MIKTVYAVEITLTKITYDADHFGAKRTKPSIVTSHEPLLSWYVGSSSTEAQGTRLYTAGSKAIERAMKGRKRR